MIAVAYARYSSDNQKQESITAQLRAIHSYALRENIQIATEHVDEARSATTDDRPEFQKMLKDIESINPSLILVHKLDRFARDRIDSGYYRWFMKKKRIRLLAVEQDFGDGPEASLMEAVIEGFAEYSSKNLSKETKKGLYEAVIEGKHCGGIPSLGYDVGPDVRYVINEYEANAVKLIFQMKSESYNYSAIMQVLNKEGYKTKKGNVFGKNSLHDILRNEKYIGNYVYRKTSTHSSRIAEDPLATMKLEGLIPPIIDTNLFYLVQDMMDGRKVRPRLKGETLYLLTGIAKCAECGHALVGSSEYQNSKQYYYYRCNHAKRTSGAGCANKKRCLKEDLEKEVLHKAKEMISALSTDLDNAARQVHEGLSKKTELDDQASSELRPELIRIHEELNNLIASMVAGVDAKFVAPKINELGRKKETLEKRLQKRQNNVLGINEIKVLLQKYVNLDLENKDVSIKRETLLNLIESVIVGNGLLYVKPKIISG